MPIFNKDPPREERDPVPRASEDGAESAVDEHTRLLPNRVDSGRQPVLLSPDDPAVSPYNLWTIRVLRFLTIIFTLLTFVWWVILLVSAFATPSGFHTRGSGFYAFSYASLTLSNMLITVIFFGVPSKSVRIISVVMSGFLLLDMILILSITRTRYEEGWVGVASVIWALLMSIWTIITDRTVKWGKAEEEERLTGRAESRRTVTEWTEVLLSTIGFSIMTVAVVLITLSLILRGLDAGVAPPGKMYEVDAGRYRIHVYCNENKTTSEAAEAVGNKIPTVLLEGGERPVEQGLWSFADNALKNGTISRYCFADRPGLAWSDTSPSPLSAGFAVDALSEALAAAGEEGPWILASAGIGSVYSRVFSARHGDAVKGMLLIDPLHEDLLGEVASPGRGFLLWLRGVISPLGIDKLPGAIFRGRTSRDRIYGRSVQQSGKYIFAKLQESLVASSFTKRDVESARRIQMRDVPLVVVSSGIEVKHRNGWGKKQNDLTKLTDKLIDWNIVDKAPHRVWETLEGREKIEKGLKKLVKV